MPVLMRSYDYETAILKNYDDDDCISQLKSDIALSWPT